MDLRVTAGREIIVGSVLILSRGSLIAFAGALVVIRPRLILIARGLVPIRRRLILVALGLAAINATGRTARNVAHLAAGWTPHEPRHHFPFVG